MSKSIYIKLPCAIGDYIKWKNKFGKIVALKVTGFSFNSKGKATHFHTEYSDIRPTVGGEDVYDIIPKEEYIKENTKEPLVFKSSLSTEEIENNFKDFNLFEELRSSLKEAIQIELNKKKKV